MLFRLLAGFNTQPPEGGWRAIQQSGTKIVGFNTQPPEGGWMRGSATEPMKFVSTHSRPKAAGMITLITGVPGSGFNTQPPEGGWKDWACFLPNLYVSTHSRPKAAGF